MDNQTLWARDFFSDVRDQVRLVRDEQRVLEARRERLNSLGSQRFDGDGVHGGSIAGDKFGDQIALIGDYEAEYEQHCKRAVSSIKDATSIVSYMMEHNPHNHQWAETLQLRYIDDMSDTAIARIMQVSRATVVNWSDAGIDWLDHEGRTTVLCG